MNTDAHLIEAFSSTRILCVGDVMLDQFIKGSISRISPEAPIPILGIQEEIAVLGGAGNVVRNLEALGSFVTFISVIGKDRNGLPMGSRFLNKGLKVLRRKESLCIIGENDKIMGLNLIFIAF